MARSFSSKGLSPVLLTRNTGEEGELISKQNVKSVTYSYQDFRVQETGGNTLSQKLRWKRKERKIYQLEESVEKGIVLGCIQQIFIEHMPYVLAYVEHMLQRLSRK